MKALTVKQPWAAAIVQGPKRIENRTWRPPVSLVGSRILIHAALTFDVAGAQACAHRWWPNGYTTLHYSPEIAWGHYGFRIGEIVGSALLAGFMVEHGRLITSAGVEHKGLDATTQLRSSLINSPWWAGPVGWILDDVRAYRATIACKGKQGLWTPDRETLGLALSQERGSRGA